MTSAPKCSVCGASHWSNQPHVFADTPKVSKTPAKPALAQPARPPREPDALSAYLARERERKAAYMREYRKTHPKVKR